jgi:hypothetical protein
MYFFVHQIFKVTMGRRIEIGLMLYRRWMPNNEIVKLEKRT